MTASLCEVFSEVGCLTVNIPFDFGADLDRNRLGIIGNYPGIIGILPLRDRGNCKNFVFNSINNDSNV